MVQRVGRCIQQAACSFRRAGVPDPEQSALQLMLSAHGLSRRSELELDRELDPSVLREWETMCARRRNREPVQYIVGEWDFHDLTLSCKPPVLIPRPETEQLVELILENVAQNENTKHTPAYRLLDVGSGTGAIGLALLAKLGNGSECVGIDSSEEACLLSRQNRDRVQLPPASTYSAVHSSINKYQDQSGSGFDFVVSNPPYIPHKARAELQPEVMEWEDHGALFATDPDGMQVILQVIENAPRLLRGGNGRVWLEVDESQPSRIAQVAPDRGFKFIRCVKDWNGFDRFCELLF